MAIEEVVRKGLADEHTDVIRDSLRWVVQELMEAEVSELIGAQRGGRTGDRATHRNGYRPRRWDTAARELLSGVWEARWPKRPSWLARRLHGDSPPTI